MRLLAVLPLLLLTGCLSKAPEPIVITKVIPPVIIDPPLPTPVNLIAPKFYVITKDNCSFVFDKNSEDALFAVSSVGYQDLSGNVQELRRYILETQALIKFYKSSLTQLKEAAEKQDENMGESR